MYQAKSKVKAERAAKYVDMLSHHFSRKVTVEKSEACSQVQFPMGLCHMSAVDGALVFRCEADSNDALQAVQSIIDRHIPLLKHIKDTKLDWTLETL
ncbi:DUF2218 domain-containing protein [Arenicella xantha]|uniref:DUF2218 domain-containing protein n=1 Tax=Arenicella xantha TaxID=644221 RepID=A0A395JJY2_9GAMM|nr:DUF2218 domain-containing protein [Arenicella xantha]RBP50725.1 hypothetical protein DFR28_102136 [Arenicella xantha]